MFWLLVWVVTSKAAVIPRPVFCDALMTSAVLAPRPIGVTSIDDARGALARVRRRHHLLTDLSPRRAVAADAALTELAVDFERARSEALVTAEYRGEFEVEAARLTFTRELSQSAGAVARALEELYPSGRRADRLAQATSGAALIGSLGVAYLSASVLALGTIPLALGAVAWNEVGDVYWRRREVATRGLNRHLQLLQAAAASPSQPVVSILRGRVTVPTCLNRGLLARGHRAFYQDEFVSLVEACSPVRRRWTDPSIDADSSTREIEYMSLVYTEPELRWLLSYRVVRPMDSSDETPAVPLRSWLPRSVAAVAALSAIP